MEGGIYGRGCNKNMCLYEDDERERERDGYVM